MIQKSFFVFEPDGNKVRLKCQECKCLLFGRVEYGTVSTKNAWEDVTPCKVCLNRASMSAARDIYRGIIPVDQFCKWL